MRYTLNAIGLGQHDKALGTVAFVRDMKARSSCFDSNSPLASSFSSCDWKLVFLSFFLGKTDG